MMARQFWAGNPRTPEAVEWLRRPFLEKGLAVLATANHLAPAKTAAV
jgi:hypothetical protein